jgi:glycosyltransferase 2 family protein
VHEFFHAVGVFFDELAAVAWGAIAIALGFHLVKLLLRAVAYRNILRASYPEERIRWAPVAGAYIAGVGVNSIVPGRGGDLVKLYVLRHRYPATNYATLGSTLVAETLLDFVLASLFFLWALTQGVLPSIHTPSFDWGWLLEHSRTTAVIVAGLTVFVIWLWWRASQSESLKERLGRGIVILRDRRRYLREVASWQLLSWVCRIASLYWFLRAFHIHATVHNALLAQVVDSLSTLLPFSPGGAGTKQGFLVAILHGQASTSRLLAFSIGMYVAVTLFNVAIGAIAIFATLRTLRLREILGRARAAEGEAKGTG